jgi:O-antigen/teichoic acid export membrane protein
VTTARRSAISRLLRPGTQLSPAAAVAQSVCTKLLIIGINAATGIITARTLQPAGRGELAAMILWPTFLSSVTTLGIPSALTFQLRSNPEKRSQLLGAGLLLALLTSILAALVGLLFVRHWIAQYPVKTILFAQMFLLSTPLGSILLAVRAALESRGDFGASNRLLIAPPSGTLICLLILMASHALTPYSAGIAYVLFGGAPAVWMLHGLSRVFKPRLEAFRSSARLLFSYGIRSYGIDLCGTMALYVDQALVVRILQPKMMGIYVVALSLSRMLNAFHVSVVMVLFPKAVSQSSTAIREMTSRALRMTTLLTASAGLVVIALGPQVLALLYGSEYRTANAVLRILVVEVVLSGATLVLSQAFMAIGRPGVIAALQLIGVLLTVPLMLLFVPRFGVDGAGLALLISTTARLIFVLASFPIFLKMPIPDIFPKWEDFLYVTQLFSKSVRFLGGGPLPVAEGTES